MKLSVFSLLTSGNEKCRREGSGKGQRPFFTPWRITLLRSARICFTVCGLCVFESFTRKRSISNVINSAGVFSAKVGARCRLYLQTSSFREALSGLDS